MLSIKNPINSKGHKIETVLSPQFPTSQSYSILKRTVIIMFSMSSRCFLDMCKDGLPSPNGMLVLHIERSLCSGVLTWGENGHLESQELFMCVGGYW